MSMVESKPRSGWVTLAAFLVLIAGGYNLVWGYAALDKKELFDQTSLIYENLDFWGVFFLVVGAFQVFCSILLFIRRTGGAILVGFGATASAFIAFFSLLANADWALAIIALDVLILWSVFSHMEDFG